MAGGVGRPCPFMSPGGCHSPFSAPHQSSARFCSPLATIGPTKGAVREEAGIWGNDSFRLTSRTFHFNMISDELLYTFKKLRSSHRKCCWRCTPHRLDNP